MKDRPILFSGPMVLAILDGRKTQTRRVIKPQPPSYWPKDPAGIRCPYGVPGDRLWVKEAFSKVPLLDETMGAVYRADSEDPDDQIQEGWQFMGRWTSSRFMPKRYARIWMEVVSVRAQWVQNISDEDAMAEGVEADVYGEEIGIAPRRHGQSARINFMELWDSINSKRGFGWDTNPWTWAITFKRANSA
ncbi:MAG: hypothetical protein IMZ50_15540 [Candidatus Atribacteria bacterium]|nr:hypothetical protein [Candidatus Atribacteria bacterium]